MIKIHSKNPCKRHVSRYDIMHEYMGDKVVCLEHGVIFVYYILCYASLLDQQVHFV